MIPVWLCVAAAVSAIVHLAGEYTGRRVLVYVAKPLTTTLLIAAAAAAPAANRDVQIAIVVGLICSLAGDVFLMLPRDHFIAGLASFLLAHIAYIVAFRTPGAPITQLLPYAALALAVMAVLWRSLGKLRLPVIVYVLVLVTMAWQATASGSALAATGAALFVISDATLAINRFRYRFAAAQAVIMSTYVAAQTLIALSV